MKYYTWKMGLQASLSTWNAIRIDTVSMLQSFTTYIHQVKFLVFYLQIKHWFCNFDRWFRIIILRVIVIWVYSIWYAVIYFKDTLAWTRQTCNVVVYLLNYDIYKRRFCLDKHLCLVEKLSSFRARPPFRDLSYCLERETKRGESLHNIKRCEWAWGMPTRRHML